MVPVMCETRSLAKGKGNLLCPLFIIAGSVHPLSTSPLNVPSPLAKRITLLNLEDMDEDMDLFKGDRVCELIAGVPFYGNVTGAFIENDRGKKAKSLWNIKYDNDDEEDVTIRRLMAHRRCMENTNSTIWKQIENYQQQQ